MGSEMCIRDRDSERAHWDRVQGRSMEFEVGQVVVLEEEGGMRWWAGGARC